MVSVTQAGVGTYSVVLSNLYSAVVDENGETKQVTWDYSFSDNDYFGSKDDDGNLCFQLLGTSTYTIVAKVGEEKLSTGSAPASDFVVIDGSGNKVKLADVNKRPGWEAAGTPSPAPIRSRPLPTGRTDFPSTISIRQRGISA